MAPAVVGLSHRKSALSVIMLARDLKKRLVDDAPLTQGEWPGMEVGGIPAGDFDWPQMLMRSSTYWAMGNSHTLR